MKWLNAALGFFLASTLEVSISHAAPAATPNEKAAASFRLFLACGSKITDNAPFDRCLKATMAQGASRFDELKATEFLTLGLKISSIGTCPKTIREPASTNENQYACFFVPVGNANGATERGLSGEIEFAKTKNGELKVRRVRYSF